MGIELVVSGDDVEPEYLRCVGVGVRVADSAENAVLNDKLYLIGSEAICRLPGISDASAKNWLVVTKNGRDSAIVYEAVPVPLVKCKISAAVVSTSWDCIGTPLIGDVG